MESKRSTQQTFKVHDLMLLCKRIFLPLAGSVAVCNEGYGVKMLDILGDLLIENERSHASYSVKPVQRWLQKLMTDSQSSGN